VEELEEKLKQGISYNIAIKGFNKNINLLIKSVNKIKDPYLRYKRPIMIKILIDTLVIVEEFETNKNQFEFKEFIEIINHNLAGFIQFFEKESLKEILYNGGWNLDNWKNDPKYEKCKYMDACKKEYAKDRLKLLKLFEVTDINSEDKTFMDEPALMLALKYGGSLEEFKLLMEKKPNVNLCDSYGRTILMEVVQGMALSAYVGICQLEYVIQLLIDNGADLSLKYNGQTALDFAREILDELILGSNKNNKDDDDELENKLEKFRKIVEILEKVEEKKKSEKKKTG
ncbi:MAG: ankyrin repeat domain-containing protein, partial [Firmicutes bacterium]|nr:ankyrin repeat domain-containing protein [Bacillota bacterium]